MKLGDLLKDKELPILVRNKEWDDDRYFEVVYIRGCYAIGFNQVGTPFDSYFGWNEVWELFQQPKKLVKKYKCLLKFKNKYYDSMFYFSTIEEAKAECIDSEVIKLLPHTEIEVEE